MGQPARFLTVHTAPLPWWPLTSFLKSWPLVAIFVMHKILIFSWPIKFFCSCGFLRCILAVHGQHVLFRFFHLSILLLEQVWYKNFEMKCFALKVSVPLQSFNNCASSSRLFIKKTARPNESMTIENLSGRGTILLCIIVSHSLLSRAHAPNSDLHFVLVTSTIW